MKFCIYTHTHTYIQIIMKEVPLEFENVMLYYIYIYIHTYIQIIMKEVPLEFEKVIVKEVKVSGPACVYMYVYEL